MFRIQQAATFMRNPARLPSQAGMNPYKGIIALDADQTFVFKCPQWPVTWQHQGDDWHFMFDPQYDTYESGMGIKADFDALGQIDPRFIRDANIPYMHTFMHKKNGCTYFIAVFTQDNTPLVFDFSKPARIDLNPFDIIIPEPDFLLLMCQTLLGLGFFIELGTQRLTAVESRSGVDYIHSMYSNLIRALDQCFGETRLFLRSNIAHEVVKTVFDSQLFAKQGAVKETKKPLLDILRNVIFKTHHLRAIGNEVCVLCDDDDVYRKDLESWHFLHAISSKQQPYSFMADLIQFVMQQLKLPSDVLHFRLQNLNSLSDRPGFSEVIADFQQSVLKSHLALMEGSQSSNGVQFQHNLPSVAYAFAQGKNSILFAGRDHWLTSISTLLVSMSGKVKITQEAQYRGFCVDTNANGNLFFVGGRTEKGKNRQAVICSLNANAKIERNCELYLLNAGVLQGTVIAISYLQNPLNTNYVAALINPHDDVSVNLVVLNVNDLTDIRLVNIHADIKHNNLDDKDSILSRRHKLVPFVDSKKSTTKKLAYIAADKIVQCKIFNLKSAVTRSLILGEEGEQTFNIQDPSDLRFVDGYFLDEDIFILIAARYRAPSVELYLINSKTAANKPKLICTLKLDPSLMNASITSMAITPDQKILAVSYSKDKDPKTILNFFHLPSMLSPALQIQEIIVREGLPWCTTNYTSSQRVLCSKWVYLNQQWILMLSCEDASTPRYEIPRNLTRL